MKGTFIFVVAALAALGAALPCMPETSSTGNRATVNDTNRTAIKERVYNGKIVSMNTADFTMVMRGREGDKMFDVSNATTYGSLTTGHMARVTYHVDKNGTLVASSVDGGMENAQGDRGFTYPGY